MDHFLYRDGRLHAEDVPLADVAAAVGTPAYVYSAATLRRHARLFDEALDWAPAHLACFAVKSLSNLAVLRVLAAEGMGADVVSGGELARALAAGVPPGRIVFSGVGKTRAEMRSGLEAGIRQFNVESEPELEALSDVAAAMGAEAPVAVRVNPDVDAGTLDQISTGRRDDKFGVPFDRAPEVYALAARLPRIRVVGADMHIGSQMTTLAPFGAAYAKLADLVGHLRAEGHEIRRLDLGGGLGIPYARESNEAPPLPVQWGEVAREAVAHLGCEIEIEPGRLVSGNAGVLLARVIYRKRGAARDFLILDAAMNDLVRPAMYGAHHDIVPLVEPRAAAPRHPVDVVGPVCESTDTFAKGRDLPILGAGDLVAFRSAGAYAAVMASEYNSRPLVPEVLVDGARWAVVRPRPTIEEMLSREAVPEWLGAVP